MGKKNSKNHPKWNKPPPQWLTASLRNSSGHAILMDNTLLSHELPTTRVNTGSLVPAHAGHPSHTGACADTLSEPATVSVDFQLPKGSIWGTSWVLLNCIMTLWPQHYLRCSHLLWRHKHTIHPCYTRSKTQQGNSTRWRNPEDPWSFCMSVPIQGWNLVAPHSWRVLRAQEPASD